MQSNECANWLLQYTSQLSGHSQQFSFYHRQHSHRLRLGGRATPGELGGHGGTPPPPAPMAPLAGSQASLYTGAPILNIQGPPFQGAYLPNPC